MRASALALAALLVGAVAAKAHPPVALVMDSRGTVYYSDLTHVWAIQADGLKRIAVRNVHTHELWLSFDDSLLGEDVVNVGERYRHRVWRLHPDGTLTNEVPWRAGHPVDFYDYSFARDGDGRSYVIRHAPSRVDVLEAGHPARSLSLGQPGEPGWLTVSDGGVAYFTVGPDLWRWDPGAPQATRVAANLVERTKSFAFVQDRHALMGLWLDGEGAIYVASYAGQVVKRVSAEGSVTDAARSHGNWSPSGGLVAPDGALWILEFSGSNEVRVRRIDRDGTERVF